MHVLKTSVQNESRARNTEILSVKAWLQLSSRVNGWLASPIGLPDSYKRRRELLSFVSAPSV